MTDTTDRAAALEAAARARGSDMENLKPCPFCGNGPYRTRAMRTRFWIYCHNCGAVGPAHDTEAEAIAAWNTRREGQHEQH